MSISDEPLNALSSLAQPKSIDKDAPDRSDVTIVIEPARGWVPLRLNELWEYRDLLYFMVWRDLKSRYRQMALGPLWIVVQPLVSMVLYTVIFGLIAKLPSDGLPYPVFCYTALLPWGFFSSAFANASGSLFGSKELISKVYFPRLIVPLSQTIGNLIDFGISFLILIGLMVYYRIAPTWGLVLLPVFILVAALTGLGTGLLFAGPIVRYRDFGQVAGYLMRMWMYATPVVYSISIIPEQWRWLYRLNPMTGVIEGFRWALLGTGQPPDSSFVASGAVVLVLFVAGLYQFKRAEHSIVDIA
jgi:lipopolysaccharide transport system permease protein